MFALLSNPHRALSFIIPDSFRPLVHASPVQQWERAKIINSFLAQIPSDASVSATTHIVPHLSSHREMLGFLALELINDAKEKISVDYIVADFKQLQQYQVAFKDDRDRLRTRCNFAAPRGNFRAEFLRCMEKFSAGSATNFTEVLRFFSCGIAILAVLPADRIPTGYNKDISHNPQSWRWNENLYLD